jgi:hypothetical protein
MVEGSVRLVFDFEVRKALPDYAFVYKKCNHLFRASCEWLRQCDAWPAERQARRGEALRKWGYAQGVVYNPL